MEAHRKIEEERFEHHVNADLTHGRAAIDEFLRITANPKEEVDPELASDVIAIAMEIGATRIVTRAQEAIPKRHAKLDDCLKCEAELQLSTAATEQQLCNLPIPEFVTIAQRSDLALPVLYRSVPSVANSEGHALLFNFFVECLKPAHYGNGASPLFRHLPASQFTDANLDRLQSAGFDWKFAHECSIPILLQTRRHLQAALAAANSQIQTQNIELAHRQKSLEALSQENTQLRVGIRDRDANIEQLSQSVAKKEGRIKALTDNIAKLNADSKAKDVAITALRQEVRERNQRIESLQSEANARNQRISSLAVEIDGQKGIILGLTQKATEREATIKSLQSDVNARDQRISSLGQDLATGHRKIQTLQNDVNARAQKIGSLESMVLSLQHIEKKLRGQMELHPNPIQTRRMYEAMFSKFKAMVEKYLDDGLLTKDLVVRVQDEIQRELPGTAVSVALGKNLAVAGHSDVRRGSHWIIRDLHLYKGECSIWFECLPLSA
jgi:predicted  nucleic acid-binding Zn-ribbon protein